jgi:hypothetical protein
MVCPWRSRYTAAAVLLPQGALGSSELQNCIISYPRAISTEAVLPSRNACFHRYNNDFDKPRATGTQKRFLFSSCHLLQRTNRSLMRNFGVVRSKTLKQRPCNPYSHLHNLTSRSCSFVVDSDTSRESTRTVAHLDRYHHQFPLDLQGWPRRWTQTVLFPHISAVI